MLRHNEILFENIQFRDIVIEVGRRKYRRIEQIFVGYDMHLISHFVRPRQNRGKTNASFELSVSVRGGCQLNIRFTVSSVDCSSNVD